MYLVQSDCKSIPLPDNSVDLIFTDPPFTSSLIGCYKWLAIEAKRVLKPGGFILALCGTLHLPEIYRFFEESGLIYFYEFYQKFTSKGGLTWRRLGRRQTPIVLRIKPILAYSKGPSLPGDELIIDVFETGPGWTEAKLYHTWGQDIETFRYFIEKFSHPGDLVLDPFIGGGTSIIAGELIGRRVIGMDISRSALITTRDRYENTSIPRPLPLFDLDPLPSPPRSGEVP